uniref:HMA domain-containing protein n=1 Tax=Davidia involucrata TaxID=16924 RepID=A0A5B6ZFH1_DAVIN
MGEKKSKNDGEKKQNDQKKNNNGGGKKDDGSTTVVLKADMHCDGCATKVKKCIRSFEGVESVKGGDGDTNKITVTGKVDPLKLREYVEQKSRKKVELVSPLPKKEKENGGGEKKTEDKPEKKPDEKKSKEVLLFTNLRLCVLLLPFLWILAHVSSDVLQHFIYDFGSYRDAVNLFPILAANHVKAHYSSLHSGRFVQISFDISNQNFFQFY